MATIRIEIGAALVLLVLVGRTLANDGVKNKTVCWRQTRNVGSALTETTVSTQGSYFFSGCESQAEHDDIVACLSSAKVWRIRQQSRNRSSRWTDLAPWS